MAKKQINPEGSKDVVPNKGAFNSDDANKKNFNDPSDFIDDTPRKWVAREKRDKDKLTIKQHLLIFHVTIIANWFSDDLYPKLMDKCIQYHQERDLASMDVTPESFYKSYSKIEYSYLKVPKKEKKEQKKLSKYVIEKKKPQFKFVRKKYINSELIESVTPFILRWYPTTAFFLQTLNVTPYILDETDYYWIYRKVKVQYPQELKSFFEKNCPDLNYNTFKSIASRKSDAKIPKQLHTRVLTYIREHFPNAIEISGNKSA